MLTYWVMPSVYILILTLALASKICFGSEFEGEKKKVDGQVSSPTLYSLTAETIVGTPGKFFEAKGAVQLSTGNKKISSDKLEYDFSTSTLFADGNVVLELPGAKVKGLGLRLNVETSEGVIDSPSYYLKEQDARGLADEIIAESEDEFLINNGSYTTCSPDDEDWYLKIGSLEVDQKKDLGIARNAMVVFKKTPILYAPYLDFSLTGKRKSGLLPPSVGQTRQSGTEFTIPYYLNIAPNIDATITPRMMSRRGFQINQEFRYLTESLSSTIQTEYLDDDQLFNDSRWGYAIFQNYRPTQTLSIDLALQSVSDDDYFTDLSDNINVTSLTNLPREINLKYSGDWFSTSARVQTFRTLQDPRNFVLPPYERVPQIRFFGKRKIFPGPDLELRSEMVDFDHPTLVTARRDVFYPSLKWPLRRSFGYLTPKVGYHYTRYSFDSSSLERVLPIYSFDTGMTFERRSTFMTENFMQTLEPRLYYVNIPYREQNAIPIFDTAESDFNLAQIFTENLFTGSDRINDADQLTAAVSSRYLDPANGEEKLRVTLAQRYYFSDQRVGLDANYVPRSSNRSDLLIGVDGQINQLLKTNIIAQYSLVEDQWERSSLMFYYKPEPEKLINLGYRFTRDSVEQLDAAAQWPLGATWSALARWNYSTRDKQLIEGVLGFERNLGCWKTRLVAHRFASSTDEYSTSFFFQLELVGLSKIGLNPLDVLRQNIQGYGGSN